MSAVKAKTRAATNLLRARKFREAEIAARQILATHGETLPALNLLATALLRQRKAAAAEQLFARSLSVAPDQLEVLIGQARAKLALGRKGEVPDLLAAAVELGTGNASDLLAIGRIYLSIDDLGSAGRAFSAAAKLKPDSAEAHAELGGCLYRRRRLFQAREALERAVSLNPSLAEAQAILGAALLDLEKHDEAFDCLQTALRIDPDNVTARSTLGRAYRSLGEPDKAAACYRELIDRNLNAPVALHQISLVKTFAPGDPDIARMREFLASPTPAISPDVRIYLTSALAKAHEDCREYDAACELYLRANRMAREIASYSNVAARRRADRVKQVFDAETIRRGRERGIRGRAPIFVVGLPRSGKTSIAQIIGRHPRISTEPEVVGFSWIVERLIPDSEDADFDADKVREALFAAGAVPAPDSGPMEAGGPEDSADLIKVSSNPANFWTLGLIEMMFPEARIVHCPRSPLEHCLALFKIFFRDPRLRFTNDISTIIEYFRIYNDLMAHWRQVLGIEIHEFPYDQLVARGEAGVRDLFAACGLDAAEITVPLPRPALGSIFDNGLFSAAPGAKADATRQEDLAMIEAYLRKIPELRQLLHAS